MRKSFKKYRYSKKRKYSNRINRKKNKSKRSLKRRRKNNKKKGGSINLSNIDIDTLKQRYNFEKSIETLNSLIDIINKSDTKETNIDIENFGTICANIKNFLKMNYFSKIHNDSLKLDNPPNNDKVLAALTDIYTNYKNYQTQIIIEEDDTDDRSSIKLRMLNVSCAKYDTKVDCNSSGFCEFVESERKCKKKEYSSETINLHGFNYNFVWNDEGTTLEIEVIFPKDIHHNRLNYIVHLINCLFKELLFDLIFDTSGPVDLTPECYNKINEICLLFVNSFVTIKTKIDLEILKVINGNYGSRVGGAGDRNAGSEVGSAIWKGTKFLLGWGGAVALRTTCFIIGTAFLAVGLGVGVAAAVAPVYKFVDFVATIVLCTLGAQTKGISNSKESLREASIGWQEFMGNVMKLTKKIYNGCNSFGKGSYKLGKEFAGSTNV